MIDRPTESTLTLTLPDGSERHVPSGTLPSEVVKSIGERLLMAAVAALAFGGFCLGSFLFHLIRGRAAFALRTLPWVRRA